MSRAQRALTMAFLATCLAASISGAGPTIPNAEVPCGINLVGTNGGVVDPKGKFTIIIRDLAFEPIEGAEIVIDFSSCAPDIRISDVQPWPGVTVECSPPLVRAVTDEVGTVVMRLVGGASNVTSGAPAAGFKCAKVFADGVEIGTVNVGAFDQNGAGGVGPADVSVWLPDSFDADFEGRSDLNCSNTVSPADLSLLLGASFASGSIQSPANYCH